MEPKPITCRECAGDMEFIETCLDKRKINEPNAFREGYFECEDCGHTFKLYNQLLS